jgi:tetratricopeptide (TPR) repeat protein
VAKSFLLLAVFSFFACARPARVEPRPSVLLITIDTLRADRLGAYGDTKSRTKALDALAGEGVLFERAYTPVPITLPAHVSLMTGLLPPAHGVRGNGAFALGPNIPTLAEALKAAGLKTAAFVGGFPLSRRFGLSRGFDEYDDPMSKAPGVNYDFAERRGRAVVDAATRWMSGNPGPVFVWVHLFDPHAPYDPPPEFRTDDPYRDEIASADAAIATLISAWDARPGPSVVVATADHGEAFGEHGEWSHSLFIYDTTLRVPLIVRAPGLSAGQRSRIRVGLTDIPATVLELARVPGTSMPGLSLTRSLAPDARDRALYAETEAPRLDFGWSDLRSLRQDGFKWIRAPTSELYALDDDPEEAKNLAAADSSRAHSLDAALSKVLEGTGEKTASHTTDAESAERLRSLGYVQGPGGRGSGADPKDKVEVARKIASATGPFADWSEAIASYRRLVALDPENPLLNLRLADALLRSGQPGPSLPFFARVVKAGPTTADPFVGYATALAQLDRLKEARPVLEQGLGVDPSSGQIHYNLGEIARIEGRFDDARREYEAALHDPVTAERARTRLSETR